MYGYVTVGVVELVKDLLRKSQKLFRGGIFQQMYWCPFNTKPILTSIRERCLIEIIILFIHLGVTAVLAT